MNRLITIRQLDGMEDHFSDSDLPLTIGSGPENHLRLQGSDELSAYIDDAQGHLFIQPADSLSALLLHNDRQLTESAWLKSGDCLRSGKVVARYERSGERIIFDVVEERSGESPVLSPPSHPPPGVSPQNNGADELPVDIAPPATSSGKKKLAVGVVSLLFLVLSCAVGFVLLARPFELVISPEPDTLSVSGLFPSVKISGRYLLLPAVYTVKAQKKGYQDFQTEVAVGQDGTSSLAVSLEKLPGLLSLQLTPTDGVEVYSGDTLLGTTPPTTIEISPGPHILSLSKPRYRPHEVEIVIEGRKIVQNLEVSLEPDWADITITSNPEGAGVTIDGRSSGMTPLTVPLLSGTHEIELNMESYSPRSGSVTVEAGVETEISFELTPLPGRLLLTSVPEGAAVNVGAEYKGTTPLSLILPSGSSQEITLSSPGYISISRSLLLSPGEERELQLTLQEEQGVVFLTVTPPEATVTINGTPHGSLQGTLTLPVRAQAFVFSAPGYKTISRTITPNPAFSQQLVIDLPADSLSSQPAPLPPVDTLSLTTATGQQLRLIQPSPFMMGAPRREPGRRANERERRVTMKQPFLISETLVTNSEFRKFDGTHLSGSYRGQTLDGDNQPVVKVTWDQAVAYLNWLSEQDKLEPFYRKEEGGGYRAVSPPTNGYRLPTEAEWAYSARREGVEAVQRYPWVGGFPPGSVVANLGDESARTLLPRVIPGYNDTFPVSSPVGYFPANKAGLYDIGGNVSEWCHDYYSAYTGRLSEEVDPLGPSAGTHRVIRGSSWRDATLAETRLSYRAYHKEARDNVGFRIARYP
ncbi:MAG: PEGA domain-containing protein [Desulfofustis sp.]|nr:PEGA domain-containing protein [Desulfofustis sp.]